MSSSFIFPFWLLKMSIFVFLNMRSIRDFLNPLKLPKEGGPRPERSPQERSGIPKPNRIVQAEGGRVRGVSRSFTTKQISLSRVVFPPPPPPSAPGAI